MKSRVVLILVCPLAIAICAVALFPKLLTGAYSHITITSVKADPNMGTLLTYTKVSSNNTPLYFTAISDGVTRNGGGGYSSRFPAWPSRGGATVAIPRNLDSPDVDPSSNLLVSVGQKYTVRPGQPLVIYRFVNSKGLNEGRLEILSTVPSR